MDKGGVNCQFILRINSRVSSFIYNLDSECANLRILMMYGHKLGGLFSLSLFVQHLASVVAIEILTTWEKSLKKECVYAASYYFIFDLIF